MISGMVGLTEARILGRRAERELVKVGLADKHGAGSAQPRCDDGIVGRDVTGSHQRSRRGPGPFEINQVLERHRNAVERPAVASTGNVVVGGARGLQRLVCHDGDEGVQLRIERFDLRETFLGQLL